MKRLNWLRNFGLTASVTAATLPAIMMSTSCSMSGYFVDVIDFKQTMYIDEGSLKNMKHYSASFNNLLYGSKSNHNGNYILFIGSNTSDSVVNFFAPGEGRRDRSDWYGDEFNNTPFYKALVKVTTDDQIIKEGIKDCGFYNFIDFFDWKFYDKKGHEIFISKDGLKEDWIIRPFDKWTQAIIDQTKLYNKNKTGYEWDSDSVKTSDYIRQDAFAVAYREMMKRGLELYPKNDKRKETFVTDDNSDSPKMCIFKDGTLVNIEGMPNGLTQSGIDAFVKVVVDNYKVVKDEKKS